MRHAVLPHRCIFDLRSRISKIKPFQLATSSYSISGRSFREPNAKAAGVLLSISIFMQAGPKFQRNRPRPFFFGMG